MPDLVVYLTEQDEIRFIKYALEKGTWLVPDVEYISRDYPRIENALEYESYRQRQVRAFFIQRDDFVRSPLEMRNILKHDREIFYISQRKGGPYLDFMGGGIFSESGTSYIRAGGFGYYPTYWDTVLERNQSAPKELRVLYSELKRFLLKGGRRLLRSKTQPWVLPGAVVSMQAGAKLVGFENHTIADLEIGNGRHKPKPPFRLRRI